MSEATPSTNLEAAEADAEAAPFVKPTPSRSNIPTPASSVTGIPVSKLKTPSNFGSNSSVSKIGRACCTHTTPKAGPPPRDTSMSRESDDNLSSINSAYTDLYQETVKRFTRSSLSPTSDWDRRSFKSSTASPFSSSDNNERRTSYDYYLEATGRRRSSDHNSAVLTANTEQFIIGQRVWVGGIRSGQIAYIGETHFAPGDWAGIVLDEPNGKNDGCVSGKRYFQCEPKRGIFSRLTRLTIFPMSGAQTPTSPLSKFSPERSRTVSPTASIRSSMLRSPGIGKNGLTVGDRVIVSSGFGSRPGILRYLGETQFAPGNWCGIELDEGSGKNDGAVDGIRYFECKPKFGVFVPIAKVSLSPSSKKTRLSRTGSRESLTSIGTMNSIATTNTSRMRMNAQQRKSSTPLKPIVTSPKALFSMQDLLREKQHHVEQLMVERELDREDAQNQALQLQKNINELLARIAHLESLLGDERKKSEDLQFSIDEAQFCGDELNAQTQVYKEKIHDLEQKITQLVSGSPSLQSVPAVEDNAALAAAQAQVSQLLEQLGAQEKQHEERFAELRDEEQRLLENIKYLKSENESLQTELVGKDESLEKFSLSESGIENLRRELSLLKEENEKQAQQAQSDFQEKLASKAKELKKVTEELRQLKSSADNLESDNLNVTDECEILQTEIKMRDEQLKELNEKLDDLTVQLSVQQADNSAMDEMIKTQQAGKAESQTAIEDQQAENGKLKAANEQLEKAKSELEQKLGGISGELEALKQQQETSAEQLKAANEQRKNALEDLNKSLAALEAELKERTSEKEQLLAQLSNLSASQEQAQHSGEELRQQLAEKAKLCDESNVQIQAMEATLVQSQAELSKLRVEATASSEKDAQELARLQAELAQLRASLSQTESESSSAAGALSGRIVELETQAKQQQEKLQKAEEAAAISRESQATLQSANEEQAKQLAASNDSLEASRAALQQLSLEHENIKLQSSHLEAQLKLSGDACAQRELELGDKTRQHEALQSKCEALAHNFEALQAELLAARGGTTELQATLKKLNEELLAKQQSYVELDSRSSSQQMQLASDNELLQQDKLKLERELKEQQSELGKFKEDVAQKQAQLLKLEEQNIKQELQLSDASRQQENQLERCQALIEQNESLQAQLTTLRSSSTDSNAELLQLSQQVVAKQKAIEELSAKSSDEKAALANQLQASQQRVDSLCGQVELLTQELKTSTEQSSQLNEQLKKEQELAGRQSLELNDASRKLEAINGKCQQLEQDQARLQQDLSDARNSSSELNNKLLQLTEHLAKAQRELAKEADVRSSERLQLERELQELKQQLVASQAETLQLKAELVNASEAKSLQATEFASLKSEISNKASKELAERQAKEVEQREQLMADYEERLRQAEQHKLELEKAIAALQADLKQLREEFEKSQKRGVELEEQLAKQRQLQSEVEQLKGEGNAATAVQAQLQAQLEEIRLELRGKDEALTLAQAAQTQLQLQQSNGEVEATQLQDKLKDLEERLEISNAELQHKEKLAKEDSQKISDLKTLVEAIQVANANISTTNAELSTVLEVLQAEKSETAHIFELFEMEADMNAERLIDKLKSMRDELKEAQAQHGEQQSQRADMEEQLKQLQQSQDESQLAIVEANEKLKELTQANEELREALQQKQAQLEKDNEFDEKLGEYQKIIDEMDEAAKEKSKLLEQLQGKVAEQQAALRLGQEAQQATQLECKNLMRKLDSVELEKARELVALRAQLANGMATKTGATDLSESLDTETSLAKINFLNSIIADMQQKNDALKAKVQTLEMLPTDFTKPHAFDLLGKRKPAPRLFCDICDEFDKHETEDCPLQASDDRDYSPPPAAEANNNDNDKKERKLPAPRKYCESCEVFGHETGECADEETY